ncbi:MAG: NAD(P)-binding domain-containing protein, partial [Pseudomonadota bacterium]
MKLILLGCGTMGNGLLLGANKFLKSKKIQTFTYDPIHQKSQALAKKVKAKAMWPISTLPAGDIYLIACKPQHFAELAHEITIPPKSLVISIVAGIQVERIKKLLKVNQVVRVMPNTPAMLGEGVSALFFTPTVQGPKKKLVLDFFKQVGLVFCFEKEDKIDLVTPFSGSGPAYFFEFTRILIEKLTSMG